MRSRERAMRLSIQNPMQTTWTRENLMREGAWSYTTQMRVVI